MGRNKIRKLLNVECSWKEKGIPRHKHDYSLECLIGIYYGDGIIRYYHVMKCYHCGSFHSISEPKNASGLVLNMNMYNLPIFYYRTNHNYRIGFNSLNLVYLGDMCKSDLMNK